MDWRALDLEGDIVFAEVCVCSEVYVLKHLCVSAFSSNKFCILWEYLFLLYDEIVVYACRKSFMLMFWKESEVEMLCDTSFSWIYLYIIIIDFI